MTQFISCDWGTSRLRLRLVNSAQQIEAEYTTDEGVHRLAAQQTSLAPRKALFGQVLDRGIARLGASDQASIVISGMASSTLGWQLLPYTRLPAPIDGSSLHFSDFSHAGRHVRLISGVQTSSDVMRGEETELVGIFANPARRALASECVVVLPGTHAKHVQVRNGEMIAFTTYLTGELYDLLSKSSTLTTSDDTTLDEAAFKEGAHASRQNGLSAALFQTRARAVLGYLSAEKSPSFLSGALIGAEVLALAATHPRQIVLAANHRLARRYSLAFEEFLPNAKIVRISPEELAAATVAGHACLRLYA